MVPVQGPLVVAFNHLTHLDAPLLIAFFPRELEVLALSDLHETPRIGWPLRAYGAITVHRGRFDRAVLRKALAVLCESGALALAPEGRMSVTGSLERATHGAAHLALCAGTPILPAAVVGTELAASALRRFRRAQVSLVFGEAYHPPVRSRNPARQREQVKEVTETFMLCLAALLPPEYRGEYGW
jgi:1-acyl-sn-glycerol-3-phosphate acyltransferase